MITAEKLETLTTFTAHALTRAINLAGYKGDMFTTAKFLGLTNGGQFCYLCTYEEDSSIDTCKVFLTYNPTDGSVIAGY
jgi:hypothetical protein